MEAQCDRRVRHEVAQKVQVEVERLREKQESKLRLENERLRKQLET